MFGTLFQIKILLLNLSITANLSPLDETETGWFNFDFPPELYSPKEWRGRPKNSKQGSDGTVEFNKNEQHILDTTMEQCLLIYNNMIAKGVAPEQARMVLPQSMMTEWYWTGSLYAFARVCDLRCASDTQEETRIIANSIDQFCNEEFPYSWKYLRLVKQQEGV